MTVIRVNGKKCHSNRLDLYLAENIDIIFHNHLLAVLIKTKVMLYATVADDYKDYNFY